MTRRFAVLIAITLLLGGCDDSPPPQDPAAGPRPPGWYTDTSAGSADFWKGEEFRKQEDWDTAKACYSVAISRGFTHTYVYVQRGRMYLKRKQFDSAIEDFSRGCRSNGQYKLDAFFLRGNAYFAKGETDRAISDYTQVIRIDPSAPAYFNRGLLYMDENDVDSAIRDFTAAIRLNPDDEDTYHWRGLAYRKKGDQAKANADFAKSKSQITPNARVHSEKDILDEMGPGGRADPDR